MSATGGIGDPQPKTAQDYQQAGNAALRALYEEIGLRLPPGLMEGG